MVGRIKSKTIFIIVMVVELTDDNFDDIVAQDKYVLVKFYTKWCTYCRLLSPVYEELYTLYQTKRNEDIIIARLEGGSNQIILARYGIYSFPVVALFFPHEKKIKNIFQWRRDLPSLDSWLENFAPRIKIEAKNNSNATNNNNNSSNDGELLSIEKEHLEKSGNVTKEDEYIKQEFIKMKKRINVLEELVHQLENVTEKQLEVIKKKTGKTILNDDNYFIIKISKSPENLFILIAILLALIAIYKTVRKIIDNINNKIKPM